MLIPLTDAKNTKVWINPVFVRMVKEKDPAGKTEIFFHVDPARSSDRFITVKESASAVADAIGETLPLIFGGGGGAMTADFAVGLAVAGGDDGDGSSGDGDGGGDGGGD